jgi:hypothetical protein
VQFAERRITVIPVERKKDNISQIVKKFFMLLKIPPVHLFRDHFTDERLSQSFPAGHYPVGFKTGPWV